MCSMWPGILASDDLVVSFGVGLRVSVALRALSNLRLAHTPNAELVALAVRPNAVGVCHLHVLSWVFFCRVGCGVVARVVALVVDAVVVGLVVWCRYVSMVTVGVDCVGCGVGLGGGGLHILVSLLVCCSVRWFVFRLRVVCCERVRGCVGRLGVAAQCFFMCCRFRRGAILFVVSAVCCGCVRWFVTGSVVLARVYVQAARFVGRLRPRTSSTNPRAETRLTVYRAQQVLHEI